MSERHTGKLTNFMLQSSNLSTVDFAALERAVLDSAPRDIHTERAAEMFNCPTWAVTTEMRRQAKVANFRYHYGGSPK